MKVSDMSLKELDTLKQEINNRQVDLLAEEKRARKENAMEFNQFLKANRDVVLLLLQHTKADCSDENPQNGFISNNEVACQKCHLIELLNGIWAEDAFEIQFNLEMTDLD